MAKPKPKTKETESTATVATTIDHNMSIWAMFKHVLSSTGNVTVHVLDGVDQFADAFNHVGQAANYGAQVVSTYAEIEHTEAMTLLHERQLKLN